MKWLEIAEAFHDNPNKETLHTTDSQPQTLSFMSFILEYVVLRRVRRDLLYFGLQLSTWLCPNHNEKKKSFSKSCYLLGSCTGTAEAHVVIPVLWLTISQCNIPVFPVHQCPSVRDVLCNSRLWIFCPSKSAHIVAALWGPNSLLVPNQTGPPPPQTNTITCTHTHIYTSFFLNSSFNWEQWWKMKN